MFIFGEVLNMDYNKTFFLKRPVIYTGAVSSFGPRRPSGA